MGKELSEIGKLRAQKAALKTVKPAVERREAEKQHASSEEKEEGGGDIAKAVIGLVVAVLKLVTNLLNAVGNAAFGKEVEKHAEQYGEMDSVASVEAEEQRLDEEIAKKMAEAAAKGEEQEQDEGQGMFDDMFDKAASMLGEKLGLGGKKEGAGLEDGEALGEESETDGPEQDGEEKGGFFAKMVQKFVKKYFGKDGKEVVGEKKEGEQSQDPQQEEGGLVDGFMKSFEDINKALEASLSGFGKEQDEKNPLKAAAKEAMGGDKGGDTKATSAPSVKEPSKGGISI